MNKGLVEGEVKVLFTLINALELGIKEMYESGNPQFPIERLVDISETADKIRKDPGYLKECSTDFLYGIWSGLDQLMPDGDEEDDPQWDNHWGLMTYLMKQMTLKNLRSEN